jgi:hypothetical protein
VVAERKEEGYSGMKLSQEAEKTKREKANQAESDLL